jgi:hypothetical protein
MKLYAVPMLQVIIFTLKNKSAQTIMNISLGESFCEQIFYRFVRLSVRKSSTLSTTFTEDAFI